MADEPLKSQPRTALPALGGWLLLLALGMICGPVASAASAYSSFIFIDISPSAHVRSVLQVETFLLSALTVFHVYVAVAFFRHSVAAPRLVTSLLVARVLFHVLDVGMVASATNQLDPRGLITSLIVAGIWIPYLRWSK